MPVIPNLPVIRAVVQRGVWPFIIIMLFSVVLIYLVPDIVTWIPYNLYKAG